MSYHRYTVLSFFIFAAALLNTSTFAQTAIDKSSLAFDAKATSASAWTVDGKMLATRSAAGASDAQKSVVLNNLGVEYANNQDFDNALSSLQKAVATNPKNQEAYINLSIASEMMNSDTEAVAAAEKAVELDRKNVRARRQLCDISLVSKLFAQAAGCFEELQKLTQPDDITLLKYGIALSQTDDAELALPILQKAVKALPDYASGWNALGTVYYKTRSYRDAAAVFVRALDLYPDLGALRYNLAITHLANKNKPLAISQYNLLSESSPDLAKKLYRVLYADKVVFVGDPIQ